MFTYADLVVLVIYKSMASAATTTSVSMTEHSATLADATRPVVLTVGCAVLTGVDVAGFVVGGTVVGALVTGSAGVVGAGVLGAVVVCGGVVVGASVILACVSLQRDISTTR